MPIRLNLKDLELSIMLTYACLCEGPICLDNSISEYKNQIDPINLLLFQSGIRYIKNGELPEIIDFLLTQEIEDIKNNHDISSDTYSELLAIKTYINWIQTAHIDFFSNLLKYISDVEIRRDFSSWIYFNKFDWKLSIEEFLKMGDSEIESLKRLNPERQINY